MVAKERVARWRDQRGDAREQLDGREDAMRGAVTRSLDRVGDATVAQYREALEREGRTRAVADQLFATDIVVGADAHGRVQVESVEQGGLAARTVRGLVVRERQARTEIGEDPALNRKLRASAERVELE